MGISANQPACVGSRDQGRARRLDSINVTGSEALLRALVREGVDTIFGYPGGAIMPVYDALYDFRDQLRHILVRHEQGASHAAEGYARVTGKVGVCFATSGPGATNLVTGIADALMDSVPLVCITGQVAKSLLGTDAFQETDVIGITMPITKWSYQVTDPSEIAETIAKAFEIAASGRPGPVVIDITKNAQIERCEFALERPRMKRRYHVRQRPSLEKVREAAALINAAEKPLVLVGHGVLISRAQDQLMQVLERSGMPVASTLLGLSAVPTKHPLYVGMLGMHGNYGPNLLTNEADLIVACGMRFDDRVTGKLSQYATKAKVIHIDVDQAEINKNVRATVGICADLKDTLAELLPLLTERGHPAWLEEFAQCAQREFDKVIRDELFPSTPGIRMSEVIHRLSLVTKGDAIVVPDVGQHQMCAARYYRFQRSDSMVTSGGLGTMGFSLPAAMGAQIGSPDRTVLAVIGDGGFQMTLQELGTIAQEKLPVKIIILNNNYLGMVRQWQELFFDKRYSFVHLQNPDFIKLSEAFDIPAERVSERDGLDGAIARLIETPGPRLLEVVVEKEGNVFPMVPAGASVSDVRLE